MNVMEVEVGSGKCSEGEAARNCYEGTCFV